MSNADLVQAYLANGGKVTKCPPGKAIGYKPDPQTNKEINQARREYRRANTKGE